MASDWATRSTESHVLRQKRLDNNADLGPNWVPDPIRPGNFGWDNTNGRPDFPPRIDPTQSCEGSAGALMFQRPSQSYASNGQWGCRFTDNDTTTIGATDSLYVQVRIKHSAALWDTTYYTNIDTSEIQGGIKFFNVQRAGGQTSSDIEQVVFTYYNTHAPVLYQGPNFAGMYEQLGTEFRMQTEIPACIRSDGLVNCVKIPKNEWFTLQLGMDMLGRVPTNSTFVDARVRLWMARDGEASTLLMDWKPGVPGYFPLNFGLIADDWRYGMCYLFPYMTGLDARQVTPFAAAWYCNLIISTVQIDDPPLVAGTAGTQPTPTRRSRVKVT